MKSTLLGKDLDEISKEIHGNTIRNLAEQGRLVPCKDNPRVLKVLPYRTLGSVYREISERRKGVLRYNFAGTVWYKRIWNKLRGG